MFGARAKRRVIRQRPRRRTWVAWPFAVCVIASLLFPTPSMTARAQSPGLEVLGELDTGGRVTGQQGTLVLGIDHETRRLYTLGGFSAEKRWIAEYDLATEIPTLLRMSEPMLPSLASGSPGSVVFDPANGRLLLLSIPTPGSTKGREIIHVDLATLTSTTWFAIDYTPGFVSMGITYSSERDEIYLVGVWEGDSNVDSLVKVLDTTSPISAIVALDGQTGEILWTSLLRDCTAPLFSPLTGGLVGLSAHRHVLYTFCKAGRTANAPTGQAGLMRLDISNTEGASGVVDLPTEFFPISGEYNDGTAGFDPIRERFFVQSQSARTHGAWVFDGLRSSWIGFVASPDRTNVYVGIDPSTGKHYMLGGGMPSPTEPMDYGYINITDGSATPVPQGLLFDRLESPSGDAGVMIPQSDVAVDPSTGRLFMGAAVATGERNPEFQNQLVRRYLWVTLRDTTPPITPLAPLDLDQLTHDLPDEDARLEFSANVSGFGAQYVNVGGWERVYYDIGVPGNFEDLRPSNTSENPANIRYGNRGATMSLVERIGISSSGSTATAIATQPDDNTPADAENKTREVTDPIGGLDQDSDEDGGEVEEFGFATCLDGIGEPVTNESGSQSEPGQAVVTCDLDNLNTTAYARFSGGTGGGGVVVSDSSFDGRTYRDPERGMVSEATAIAEGISFGEVDLGGMSIDRVTSTVTTAANGLEGTSYVRWERKVEGARTFDADGTASEPRSCTTILESDKETVEEGDCSSLEQSLNEVLPQRLEVKFPLPEVSATPKGAFASIQENETDFLSGQATNNDQRRDVPGMELTVFNDGPQRGRLWVQLAAVRSDATFIRSPIQGFGGFGPPPPNPDTVAPEDLAPTPPPVQNETFEALPGALPGPPATGGEEPILLAAHEERLVGAFGWLPVVRSLGDGFLVGVLYLLFAVPVVEVIRRRRLLTALSTDDPSSP